LPSTDDEERLLVMKIKALNLLMSLLLLSIPQLSFSAYPDKPIRLVIPSGSGGVTDLLARTLVQHLSKELGQQVFVENKPGASGIAGSLFIANSAPDGYNLLMVFPSHVTNPTLFGKLPYDTLKSFQAVSLVSNVSSVLIVPKNSPVNTIEQFISYAKSNPTQLNFASVGAGSLGHLAAELFKMMTATNITHIPYKGTPQAMTSILSGEVQMYFVASASSALPLIQSGQVKALGVSSKERIGILSDVPTIAEFVKGYEVTGWNGILAPAGTPVPIVDRLYQAIKKSIKTVEFSDRLKQEGAIGVASTPAEFQEMIKKDIDKWKDVIQKAGIHAE
jgi:tripartite-type tricarboxylate transporter receptor subunit TctC